MSSQKPQYRTCKQRLTFQVKAPSRLRCLCVFWKWRLSFIKLDFYTLSSDVWVIKVLLAPVAILYKCVTLHRKSFSPKQVCLSTTKSSPVHINPLLRNTPQATVGVGRLANPHVSMASGTSMENQHDLGRYLDLSEPQCLQMWSREPHQITWFRGVGPALRQAPHKAPRALEKKQSQAFYMPNLCRPPGP